MSAKEFATPLMLERAVMMATRIIWGGGLGPRLLGEQGSMIVALP